MPTTINMGIPGAASSVAGGVSGKRVLLAEPRGYCAGVDRAVETVERALEKHGAPVYVRHEIVHNRHVVDTLAKAGAVFVDETDEVPEGAIVVFSAHGVAPTVHTSAAERNLQVIDATCPLVTKVHMEVTRYAREAREVFLIGHAGHPEVEGTIGQFDTSLGGSIYLVETVEDVHSVTVRNPAHLAFVTQTTLSVDDTACIVEALRTRFPGLKAPVKEDICYATQNRQDAVKDLIGRCDILVVVGSQSSSNSNRLREMADKAGIPGYLIDGPELLHREWFDGAKTVGVTAGASAPEVLVQGVIAQLRLWGGAVVDELKGREEHVIFALPRTLREVAKRVGSLSSDSSAG
jgi:4-hydroxy-3-methylbut-2-enyl diphosphate reductase